MQRATRLLQERLKVNVVELRLWSSQSCSHVGEYLSGYDVIRIEDRLLRGQGHLGAVDVGLELLKKAKMNADFFKVFAKVPLV